MSESFIATSPIPLTLSDARAPDQPLVEANRAFLKLTGYGAEEVIGRNCRFLQEGVAGSQDAARATIREAIRTGGDVQVILRNRRKNGTEFDNLLFLYTIRRRGVPIYYLGSQFELTGAGMPLAAARRAGALEEELERLRDRQRDMDIGVRRAVSNSAALLVRSWLASR